jgi:hypothetical protein
MEPQATTATPAPSLVSHAIRHGAIMAIISIIITLLFYAIDYALLADWKIGILFLLIFLGYVIYAGINYRNSIGGFLSYGKAFQHGFLVLASAGLISILFQMLLYNVIDPDMPQKLADITVENTEKMMAGFGAPQDAIDKQLDQMKEEMPKRFQPMGLLISYLWALLIYAIISAITSIFVKRNEPELI